jgi:tol-pal system protein YbgF
VAEDAGYWFGEYFYNKGKFDSAQRHFAKFLKDFPNSELADGAQFHLALALEGAKKYDEAIREFLRMENEYPKSAFTPDSLMRASDILARQDRSDEAVRHLQRVVASYPHTESERVAYRKIGSILRKRKQYAEAIGNLRKALGPVQGDLNAQVQYEIGECLEEGGGLPQALEEYLTVPQRYPKSTFWSIRAQLASAKIFERLGKDEEACRLYEKLAVLNVGESKFARERLEALRNKLKREDSAQSSKLSRP